MSRYLKIPTGITNKEVRKGILTLGHACAPEYMFLKSGIHVEKIMNE